MINNPLVAAKLEKQPLSLKNTKKEYKKRIQRKVKIYNMSDPCLAVGLMSGTSLDGVDAVLLRTDGGRTIERIAAHYLPFSTELRGALMAAAKGDIPLSDLLRLERAYTHQCCQAVAELLATDEAKNQHKPAVIGFHGQTIRHLPEEGLTWQTGDSSYLAHKTGIPVVADFRRRDMACGGQGAPLASYYHQAVLPRADTPQVVANIGGVANITSIAPNGEMQAGDVGPGCALLDVWVQKHFSKLFDEDGHIALGGKVDEPWLEKTLRETPFFSLPLPKSADRYLFDSCWPEGMAPQDGAATLSALTAECIAKASADVSGISPALWLTGGGAKNKAITQRLSKKFTHVKPIDDIGVSGDSLEAECFAWLAVRRLEGLATSGPQTTGAQQESTGGVLTA